MSDNPGHSCFQDGRIGRIEQAVEQLSIQVPQIIEKLSGLEEKVEMALKRQEEHHETLFGGRGATGIMAWKEKADETLNELKIALKGYGKEPGLISIISTLVEKIDQIEDDRKWLIRLVLANIIGALLGMIIIASK